MRRMHSLCTQRRISMKLLNERWFSFGDLVNWWGSLARWLLTSNEVNNNQAAVGPCFEFFLFGKHLIAFYFHFLLLFFSRHRALLCSLSNWFGHSCCFRNFLKAKLMLSVCVCRLLNFLRNSQLRPFSRWRITFILSIFKRTTIDCNR